MSIAINKIKNRIKSVQGAYKVTSAMKLVSSVKLRKYKDKMLSNLNYVNEIKDTINELVNKSTCKLSSPFINENKNAIGNLYVVVSSSLGLCGSYNVNIFKLFDSLFKEEDSAIILGKKGITRYQNKIKNLIPSFEEYSSIENEDLISSLCNYILSEYEKGTYKQVILIHSEYKNAAIFLPVATTFLPLKDLNATESVNEYPPIFEPKASILLSNLLPFYFLSTLYATLLESEVCEQASRSNAMENATNNANEILEELNVEFNKSRQSSITQEIIEIVSGSNV